jgi:glycerol-3-phosphate dehydrogenase (NAD(P)+)
VHSVAVINAGGWGTALAIKLANQGHDVRLWARRPELAAAIAQHRENRQYLPYVTVPPSVQVTSDLGAAVNGAEMVLVAVIAVFMRQIARQLGELVRPEALVLHGTKGLQPQSRERLSEVLVSELGPNFEGRVAVLSGPNHAEEVARQLPTAAVVACADGTVATELQKLLNTEWFRVYTNSDIVGVELCSAAKNVIAIASGIGDGLGYGDNGKAALITRALAEMGRLVEAYHGASATVFGLAGVGDVIATCTSRHSRNRWAGEQIGQGRDPAEIQASTSMVIEGIPSTSAIVALARAAAVEMPICEGVHRVLFEGQSPSDALRELMARDSTAEA